MEHQSSGVSDMRKKIDSFVLSDTGRDKDDKNMTPRNQREIKFSQSEHKYDLRRSLAWDNAFFTSQGFLEPEELLQCLYLSDKQNSSSMLCQEENKLVASGFLEDEAKNRTDENTARTSLAWDNAFFTNEGVLDHEELSMVNKGFKRTDARRLQRIEEIRKFSDSNSTIDSEGSSLAIFEIEIFEDMKASTHKMRETSHTIYSGTELGRKNGKQTNQTTATKNFPGSLELKVNHIPKAPNKAMYSLANQVKRENKIVNTATGNNSSMSIRSDLKNSGNTSLSSDDSGKSLSSRSKFDSSLAKPGAYSSGFIHSETESDDFPRHNHPVKKSSHATPSSSSFISACCLEPPITSINQSPYKPSGLRMPTPKIGFFYEENKLAVLPTEYEDMKSHPAQNHSSEKIQPKKTLSSDSGAERTCPRKTRLCAVTGAGKDLRQKNKSFSLRKDKILTVRGCAELLVESVSKPENKLGAMKKNMIREDGKHVLDKTRKQSHKELSGSLVFHDHEKENLFGPEKYVHGLSVPAEGTDANGDVVLEVEAKNGHYNS